MPKRQGHVIGFRSAILIAAACLHRVGCDLARIAASSRVPIATNFGTTAASRGQQQFTDAARSRVPERFRQRQSPQPGRTRA